DDDATGSAYVFGRGAGGWTEQAVLRAAGAEPIDLFGASVAIDGDTIVVGATGEDGGLPGIDPDGSDNTKARSGAAYVFVRTGTTWAQQAYIKASNPSGSDYFGTSVAVFGDTAIVGAPLEDSSANGIDGDQGGGAADAGAAYVFVRTGGTWTQQAYVKAAHSGAGDLFGSSVAIDGTTAVVGAPGEDSAATGVNGSQTNNASNAAGAAYVFVHDGTSWSQQAFLKASNTGGGDEFGKSVSVFGDEIAVGANSEDSSSLDINVGESDNSDSNSGAVYVFERSGSTWGSPVYVKSWYGSEWFGHSVSLGDESLVVGADRDSHGGTGIDSDPDFFPGHNFSGATFSFAVEARGIGRSGCPGEDRPQLTGVVSATSGFELDCPELTEPCFVNRVMLFGACDRIGVMVPPPLGCDPDCLLVVGPIWGSAGRLVVGPGLPLGLELCVQCGCVAAPSFLCVNLSEGRRILVGP
ncbi:MAG: FG-GAP repeat protein, partial [Planctomycetes bacterium]|nr:FG-GAP repeat protein [Planctomycetota bacterium]